MTALRSSTVAALRAHLPATATACVDAIVREVPGYDRAFDARFRHNIEGAVQQALTTFLDLQAGADHARITATLDGARTLGHGEANSGRSTDALLRAYRVGARVAWQNFSAQALDQHEDAAAIATLAAGTFAFIDELSAASLSGHTQALTRRTRELARRRDQLASALAAGENRVTLERLAEHARWRTPETLTALVIDGEPDHALTTACGEHALWAPASSDPTLALLSDINARQREEIVRSGGSVRGCLGPTVTWHEATDSIQRAHRALRLAAPACVVDADALLPELLLDADHRSAAKLTERALAPLNDLTEAKRDALAETLLTWLLLQGRRDEVADALHVHPQTVRYRMNQLRDLYGDRLTTARNVLELVIGLSAADVSVERSRS